jgi:hypothetical protein
MNRVGRVTEMPKSPKRKADENPLEQLMEDLERLAELFEKHDLQLQRKLTETLKETLEQQTESKQKDS